MTGADQIRRFATLGKLAVGAFGYMSGTSCFIREAA